jgi:lipopolysaccharide export system protein LptC
MGRFNRSFFGLTLLLLGGCGSNPRLQKQVGGGHETNGKDQSELKMSDMRVQSYGNSGVEWELKAPFGEVFSRKNLMRLKTLTVQLFESGQKSTDISANQGVMSTGPLPEGEKEADKKLFGIALEPGDMHLSGDVVMISTDGTKISTEWAQYHKKTEMITSSAPVKVERDDSITYGVGMEASADMTRVHIFNETLVIPEKIEDPKL